MDFEIRGLSNSIDRVESRGKAAIFGACGRALLPLLRSVEAQTNGRWTFSDVDLALDLIEEFATGLAEAADHADLRARLMGTVPHGHDLGAPWSTYAQDALICTDAGLAAASATDSPKSIWIQYALEPLMASTQIRDSDVIRSRGEDYWSRGIVNDPAMATALAFLRSAIAEVARNARVNHADFGRLVEEATVLLPVDR
jgi:hypothetical protein